MKTSSTLIAAFVLATPLAGMAINPQPLPPNEHALNLPGATTIDAPPASFDPINASDQDLQFHGFPPRPNQAADPDAYAAWETAMKASKTRVVPQLVQSGMIHGSPNGRQNGNATTVKNALLPPETPENGPFTTTSLTGYYVQSGATSYGSSSYYFIESNFVVPAVQQNVCSGGWEYASASNGLDGFGSPDMLQAGVSFGAFCSGTIRATSYWAWYEWYPYAAVRIAGFPVAPGDSIFLEVWHTSSTQGYAYLVNSNTNQAVVVGFTAYPGYPLRGNSAEWMVQDPGALINFGSIPFWSATAYTESYVQFCSGLGTPIVNSGPPAINPIPIGPCAFVVH
jgi:Peptidase A4 family